MAEGLYTVKAVLDLLDDVPDDDGEFEDFFFPGSSDLPMWYFIDTLYLL